MELVYVKWKDSRGIGQQWTYLKNITHRISECESVGWVIHEDEESIDIAPHMADRSMEAEAQQAMGEISIPKVAIVERQRLVMMSWDLSSGAAVQE